MSCGVTTQPQPLGGLLIMFMLPTPDEIMGYGLVHEFSVSQAARLSCCCTLPQGGSGQNNPASASQSLRTRHISAAPVTHNHDHVTNQAIASHRLLGTEPAQHRIMQHEQVKL
jgi:hypothetical protein